MNLFNSTINLALSVLVLTQHTSAKALPNESIEIVGELKLLITALDKADITVKFENPPMQGSYGIFNQKKKIIWIAPITLEMGIFRSTLIHEAVHAAQSCKSGMMEPIGWKLTADNTVETSIKSILYRNYPSEKHAIEREAFLMQGQTDAIDKIKEILTKYC